MSYSASPAATQQPAPQPFSPYSQSAASPPTSSHYGPPPAKRQRTSPDPRSPAGATPQYNGRPPHGLPIGAYGNPYAPSPAQSPYSPATGATSPQNSFNTPQPYPQPQVQWRYRYSNQGTTSGGTNAASPTSQQTKSRDMMPPPPRPAIKEEREERVGVEDIGDSLFGSGINLKDEENYVHSIYNNRHAQTDSFSTVQNSSFGSTTMSPNESFNLLTQGTSFGSQGANSALAGTLGETQSQENVELEQRRKREAAARAQAERRQHHLNNQFLLCNNVRKRMDKIALNQGVSLNLFGIYVRQPETTVMTDRAGTEGVVAAQDRVKGVVKPESRPESVVNQGSPFESILSLVSLAAGERLRDLLDQAFAQARARRYGDHGRVVPPEFSDIADGEGKQISEDVLPQSVTGSQWDKVPASAVVQNGTKVEEDEVAFPAPQRTISFAGSVNAKLRELAQNDIDAERDRIKKREARKRVADGIATGDATTLAESSAPDNVMPSADAAAPNKGLTKKEQMKQVKEKTSNTEAQLHSTTNQTAAMMALGRKGRKYDWMTGGAAAMPTNRFAKPPSATASGTATPAKDAFATGATAQGGAAPARGGSGLGIASAPEWGDWREDGPQGKGIQIRDWLSVLERDGLEKRALQRAMNKLQ